MDFVPENSLEDALTRDAAAFERLLMVAPLYVIGEGAEQPAKVRDGAQVRLAGIRRGKVEWTVAFTALSRLQTYFHNAPNSDGLAHYLTMAGRSLFETVKGGHVLLNPGYQNREFPPAEIARLLATS
ncbi:MAG TPA: hypothetical protein VN932_09550 [Rhizomicrobium sp.]|nr:hypothetical protein [Rhizomicrobium sp.]